MKKFGALAEQGIQVNIINILEKIYVKYIAQIRLDIKGRLFGMNRCVRQGNPLSPNIFITTSEEKTKFLIFNFALSKTHLVALLLN